MRPRHDPPRTRRLTRPKPDVPRAARSLLQRLRRRPQRPGGGDAASDPCPVGPDQPLDLSGGAGAALEFDN